MKFFIIISFLLTLNPNKKDKKIIIDDIDKNKTTFELVAKNIWNYAEVGFQEEKSSKELLRLLKENGFKIKSGVADIPTAFIAEYNNGGSVVGILGEYDALPGLSQTTNPKNRPRASANTPKPLKEASTLPYKTMGVAGSQQKNPAP